MRYFKIASNLRRTFTLCRERNPPSRSPGDLQTDRQKAPPSMRTRLGTRHSMEPTRSRAIGAISSPATQARSRRETAKPRQRRLARKPPPAHHHDQRMAFARPFPAAAHQTGQPSRWVRSEIAVIERGATAGQRRTPARRRLLSGQGRVCAMSAWTCVIWPMGISNRQARCAAQHREVRTERRPSR